MENIIRKKILCIGNVSWDKTMRVEKFPKHNTKNRIDEEPVECTGGPSFNGSRVNSIWGMDTTFIGAIGDDYIGEKIIEECRDFGINPNYIEKVDNCKTTYSNIIVDKSNGERTIFTYRNPKLNVKNIPSITDADIILIDGQEIDASIKAINENPNAISILDAGRFKKETIILGKMVNYLVCSKDFTEAVVAKALRISEDVGYNLVVEDPKVMTEVFDILEYNFKNKIIITLGEKGCIYKNGNEMHWVPTLQNIKAEDTTGAGDIFHGALTFCIAQGYDLDKSLKIANVTGALSVTKVGSKNKIFPLDVVMGYYEKYKDTDLSIKVTQLNV